MSKEKSQQQEQDVLEFVQATKTCSVNREKGVIHGCKLVGIVSKNGGRYPSETLEAAKAMYEGAKCNLNHPNRDKPGADRGVEDRFGVFHKVRLEPDGLYADLHFLKSHPFASVACESAESMPEAFGFSHNARSITSSDGKGGVIHESITRVRSVDLVADPATTSSIFESEYQTMNDPHTEGIDGGVAMASMPETSIENDPIDVSIDALLSKALPEIKRTPDKSTRKGLLKDLMKKVENVLNALVDDPDGDGKSNEDKEASAEESPVEESVKEVAAPVVEASAEKAPVKAETSYEQAMDVLESVNVQPSKIRIKALLALPQEDRKALAESWPKIGTAQVTTVKPRSSSVMESHTETTKNATVEPTAEQLKDDALLLMSGPRLN